MSRYFLKMFVPSTKQWVPSSIGASYGYEDINEAYRICAQTAIQVPDYDFTIAEHSTIHLHRA